MSSRHTLGFRWVFVGFSLAFYLRGYAPRLNLTSNLCAEAKSVGAEVKPVGAEAKSDILEAKSDILEAKSV